MNWIEASVKTTTYGIDHVIGALIPLNIGGFSIKDSRDFRDFLTDDSFHYDYIDDEVMELANLPFSSVTFYVPLSPEGSDTMRAAEAVLETMRSQDVENLLGDLSMETVGVKDEDWSETWKKYFKPFPVGEKLIVKPSWETLPEENQRIVLEIDPKMSFGTGTHHTTRLCLETLDRYIVGGEKVLDMGCGSGILSVAALLLGAESSFAVDIDPLSSKTAKENADINNVSQHITTRCGDVLADTSLCHEIGGEYDVICANIVSDVIIAMAPLFRRFLRRGGMLIVSGIIDERQDEVINALKSHGFSQMEIMNDGGWCAAVLTIYNV